MAEDSQPFVGISKEDNSQKPIYHDASSTPTMRWIIGITLGGVFLTLLISVILIIVQTIKVNNLYTLLLISLLAFAQVEIFLMFFIYKGKMPRKYVWLIFVVGAFVVIECICTDIIVLS